MGKLFCNLYFFRICYGFRVTNYLKNSLQVSKDNIQDLKPAVFLNVYIRWLSVKNT